MYSGALVSRDKDEIFSLTKHDLIQAVIQRTDLSYAKAKEYVESFTGALTEALKGGERVELRGLGTFGTRVRNAGEKRNPKDGTPIFVPAKRVAYFKLGKDLRHALCEERDEAMAEAV